MICIYQVSLSSLFLFLAVFVNTVTWDFSFILTKLFAWLTFLQFTVEVRRSSLEHSQTVRVRNRSKKCVVAPFYRSLKWQNFIVEKYRDHKENPLKLMWKPEKYLPTKNTALIWPTETMECPTERPLICWSLFKKVFFYNTTLFTILPCNSIFHTIVPYGNRTVSMVNQKSDLNFQPA